MDLLDRIKCRGREDCPLDWNSYHHFLWLERPQTHTSCNSTLLSCTIGSAGSLVCRFSDCSITGRVFFLLDFPCPPPRTPDLDRLTGYLCLEHTVVIAALFRKASRALLPSTCCSLISAQVFIGNLVSCIHQDESISSQVLM